MGLAGDYLERAALMQPFWTPSRLLTKEDYQDLVLKRGPAGHYDVGYKLYFHHRQSYYVLAYTNKTGKTEVVTICLGARLAYDLYNLCIKERP